MATDICGLVNHWCQASQIPYRNQWHRGCPYCKFEAVRSVISLDIALKVHPWHSRPPSQSRKSTETRFDLTELKHSCMLINTADYCQTTALEVRSSSYSNTTVVFTTFSQLEEKIREKIDDDYKEKISLQMERDLFVRSAILMAFVVKYFIMFYSVSYLRQSSSNCGN